MEFKRSPCLPLLALPDAVLEDVIVPFSNVRDLVGLHWTCKALKKITAYYYNRLLPLRICAAIERATPMFISAKPSKEWDLVRAASADFAEMEQVVLAAREEDENKKWDLVRESDGRLTDSGLLDLIEDEHKPSSKRKGCWTWITRAVPAVSMPCFKPRDFCHIANFESQAVCASAKFGSEWRGMPQEVVHPRIGGLCVDECNRVLRRLPRNSPWGTQTFDAVSVIDRPIPEQGKLFVVDLIGISFNGKELVIPNMRAFYHRVALLTEPEGVCLQEDIIVADAYHRRLPYAFVHTPSLIAKLALYHSSGQRERDVLTYALANITSDQQRLHEYRKQEAKADKERLAVYAKETVITNFATGYTDYLRGLEKPQKQTTKRKLSWSEKREKLLRG